MLLFFKKKKKLLLLLEGEKMVLVFYNCALAVFFLVRYEFFRLFYLLGEEEKLRSLLNESRRMETETPQVQLYKGGRGGIWLGMIGIRQCREKHRVCGLRRRADCVDET